MAAIRFERPSTGIPMRRRPRWAGMDLDIATASSWCWSARPAAASRRRCGCWPASRAHRWVDLPWRPGHLDDGAQGPRHPRWCSRTTRWYPHMTVGGNMEF